MKKKAIQFNYIYSACTTVKTPDISILTDPWFSEGIMDGSWFHFPKIKDPLKLIGNTDIIYISHIDPDHYDPIFLRKYFKRYGLKKIIISNHEKNFLEKKMKADGFNPEIIKKETKIGNTYVEIIPHKTGSISDIDSGLIVKYLDKNKKHCLVNTNDIVIDDNFLKLVKRKLKSYKVDILACGYTGAGPYPQTYFSPKDKILKKEIKKKLEKFEKKYKKTTNFFNAKVNVPFAGEYILGGDLKKYNLIKGNPDPIEIKSIDTKAVVFFPGGGINTLDYQTTKIRNKKYTLSQLRAREKKIMHQKMDYEKLINSDEIYQLPIKRLMTQAAKKANKLSECSRDFYYVFKLFNNEIAVVNANKNVTNNIFFKKSNNILPKPRCEINIDLRYLFGLITNIYHWANAAGGSHYSTRRIPNIFDNNARNFLNFFSI